MADIVTFKKTDSKILIELYHLKFAKYNKPSKKTGKRSLSASITNLYEVCGQAQKSVRWKFKESREVFEHLFKRKIKRLDGEECPRIEKGTEDQLKEIMQLAKQKLPVEFKIYVVQPAIQKSKLEQEHLEILAVTENYLKAKGIALEIIGSE